MKILKLLFLILFSLALLLLVWGFVEPRVYLDVEEESARLPNLSSSWEGQQLALISDLQVGLWLDNTGMVRRTVERLIELRPAAVLITGDFICDPEEDPDDEIEELVTLLRPLTEAKLPTYAVLGNHDYGITQELEGREGREEREQLPGTEIARRITQALEQIGVQVLENEAVALPAPNGGPPLYLVGIDSDWAERARPELAFAQVPRDAARVVMMHNPRSFEALPPGAAPLAVAGHTHGGQIRIPFTPEWSWLTYFKEGGVHVDGWGDAAGNGNQLYVNRGIGFSWIPLRINCPPELTLFTLRAARDGVGAL